VLQFGEQNTFITLRCTVYIYVIIIIIIIIINCSWVVTQWKWGVEQASAAINACKIVNISEMLYQVDQMVQLLNVHNQEKFVRK
jgi:flagellar basal body-associated protein FliL